jgi:hypothetical protein
MAAKKEKLRALISVAKRSPLRSKKYRFSGRKYCNSRDMPRSDPKPAREGELKLTA